jgi:hypothetical protein
VTAWAGLTVCYNIIKLKTQKWILNTIQNMAVSEQNSYLNITHNAIYMYTMFPNKLHVHVCCLQVSTPSFNTIETHCNLTIKNKTGKIYIYILVWKVCNCKMAKKWLKFLEVHYRDMAWSFTFNSMNNE